ncbi:MAG: LysM peptidoglycan-binding domain-containing protein [Rhizomicrobium sp.]
MNSDYTYRAGGRLASVAVNDGHPRTITFGTNIEGQILSRSENDNNAGTVDQNERHFYFDGMALGDVSNNGTSDTDYAASIAAHIAVPGSGNLRGGATVAMPYADFDQSYDPVNGITYAGAPSHYTAQDGDTLAGIAAMVWGDASLWYLIADANGLSSPGDSLTAGTDLILPNKVVNLHNNAGTFKVYDPNEAIGDTAPTVPKQPKHDNGCGVLGQILLAVIAIAVTVVTAGAAVAALGPVGMTLGEGIGAFFGVAGAAATTIGTAGFVAIGAGAAALGSIVSQGVGLATGIQDSFNWGAVGLAAIGGGISGGLGANGGLLGEGGILGSTGDYIADAALQGAAVSAATQGIGVATGLQNSFDWTGVVAAGIGAAAGTYVGHLLTNSFSTGGSLNLGGAAANLSATRFLSGMAADIANAATRTLINGSDFGDNIIAALPDTIGQTIGGTIEDAAGGAFDAQTPAAGSGSDTISMSGTGGHNKWGVPDGILNAQTVINEADTSFMLTPDIDTGRTGFDWNSFNPADAGIVRGGGGDDTETVVVESQQLLDAAGPQAVLQGLGYGLSSNGNIFGTIGAGSASSSRYSVAANLGLGDGRLHFSSWGGADYPDGRAPGYSVGPAQPYDPRYDNALNMRRLEALGDSPIGAALYVEGHILGADQHMQDAALVYGTALNGALLGFAGVGGRAPSVLNAQSELETVGDAADSAAVRVGPYGDLTAELKGTGIQANHLNQDAAFRDLIPRNDGLAVGMRGNAFTEVGSAHYEFHSSLEEFWSPYRDVDSDLFGLRPTNGEYGTAVEKALVQSGYTPSQAASISAQAAGQRASFGLTPETLVPRVPGRLPQRAR